MISSLVILFLLTQTTMVSKTYGNIVRFIYKTIVVSNNEFGITTRVIEERIHVRQKNKYYLPQFWSSQKGEITITTKLGYSSQLNRGNYFIVIRTKYFHNVVFVTMLVLLTMTKKPKGVVYNNKKPFNFYKV